MMTKKQEEKLNKAIENLIYDCFTSSAKYPTELSLYYDSDDDTFDYYYPTEYASGDFLISVPVQSDLSDLLNHSYADEVQAIITDPEAAEFKYPQDVIDSVKELIESEDYDPTDREDAMTILEESGAKDCMQEQSACYYTEDDLYYFEDLKSQAIEAFDELQEQEDEENE